LFCVVFFCLFVLVKERYYNGVETSEDGEHST